MFQRSANEELFVIQHKEMKLLRSEAATALRSKH